MPIACFCILIVQKTYCAHAPAKKLVKQPAKPHKTLYKSACIFGFLKSAAHAQIPRKRERTYIHITGLCIDPAPGSEKRK